MYPFNDEWLCGVDDAGVTILMNVMVRWLNGRPLIVLVGLRSSGGCTPWLSLVGLSLVVVLVWLGLLGGNAKVVVACDEPKIAVGGGFTT